MNKNRNGLRFLGHPIHPLLVHFPMALWMISLVWDILGLWRGDPLWWNFSFWSIAAGLIFAAPVLVTGLIDSVSVPQGPEEGIATRHMMIMLAASTMYGASLFFRVGLSSLSGTRLIIALTLSIVGFIFLVIGGWYGAELVYRYGVGGRHLKSNNEN